MGNRKIKIVTIGGGSSYTPELIEGFINRKDQLPISEIWLVDIEEGKEKLEIVGSLAKRMIKNAGLDWTIKITFNRREALKNADFVITQLRVGSLDARIKDERIPLSYGIVGQETNGAGGIFQAFRTIPVILSIVEDMKELCHNAWLVNFTNPAGMVTEAVLKYGKFNKVVGLCNGPIGSMKSEVEYLEKTTDELYWQFAGLNHFNWHKVFDKAGNDLTEVVIEKMFKVNETEIANSNNLNFIKEQVEDLGMIPCMYHKYYYLSQDMLDKELEEFVNNETRAEVVKRLEQELFEIYKNLDLLVKPKETLKRGGIYYSDAACELISSMYNDKRRTMVVNTRNNGAISDLPYDCACEVSSIITSHGPDPINFGRFPNAGQRGLVQVMKAMEELTIEASVTGDYKKALQAFTTNPLIPTGTVAKELLNEMLIANKKYLPQFKDTIESLEREKYS